MTITFGVLVNPSADLEAVRARLHEAARLFGCTPTIQMIWTGERDPIRVEATCEAPALPPPRTPAPAPDPLSPTFTWGGT